jgi:dTMP kinase
VAEHGFFLVLEGGEGSGKSTVARAVADRLRACGREVLVTREPGGTPVAEQIRALLLSDGAASADPWCEALLFAAARADHMANAITPALTAGAVVICDRFVDSSVAYQGVGRGLGMAAVRAANAPALQGRQPDLVVVLDVDPATGLARAVGPNRMEAEQLAFHEQVREAFLAFAAADPGRYAVVDAGLPADQVAAAVLAELDLRGVR